MFMYSMYIMYAYIFHNHNNVITKLSNNNNYWCKKLKTYEKKKNYIYNKHITKDLHYFINHIYKYLKISMYKSLCIYIYV